MSSIKKSIPGIIGGAARVREDLRAVVAIGDDKWDDGEALVTGDSSNGRTGSLSILYSDGGEMPCSIRGGISKEVAK